jgi:hypothetical protein
MALPPSNRGFIAPAGQSGPVAQILGYLNFSAGRSDPGFQRQFNEYCAVDFAGNPTRMRSADDVRDDLLGALADLWGKAPAFSDVAQADAVIRLAFDKCLPAYRAHHADLLFHLPPEDFEHPLFLARLLEAVLEEGAPWDDSPRIVSGCIDRLNDFLGHRPVAILENGRKMEPYAHERFRPVPLYIQAVGAGCGRYHNLISHTLKFFEETPKAILRDSYFELENLEELSLDMRAHDHMHPVNKRTNYMFGEWDPHRIDLKGNYRRFVVRKIILDALLRWMDSQEGVEPEEVLFDASAVLCGTMLMASSISGAGPTTFDSTITLSGLLPKVARQRDAFYERILKTATGSRATRLKSQESLTRQPFGHVRQRLNIELANYGARQVQFRHLAQIYAKMGYADASRRQAAAIPSTSVRFETEIRWRIASAHQRLDRGDLCSAAPLAAELTDHLRRGIDCGALIDPWNILGFQGQFPLFFAREDSLPDQRAEILLDLVDGIFGVFSRIMNEASAQGRGAMLEEISERYRVLADEWDRYATTTVEDLPKVSGRESFESAQHVSKALGEWRLAGEAAGAISFWRQHVSEFQSAKAYALVVEALLQRNDAIASMGLLMQWLSQAEEAGVESGGHSLFQLLLRWMDLVIATGHSGDRAGLAALFRRLFDYLEANAGDLWVVPALENSLGLRGGQVEEPAIAEVADEEVEEDEDDEDNALFEAAWDDVIWRDSADDGNFGDTLDEHVTNPQDTEFELLARKLEPRLRFLSTVAELWQKAAIILASQGPLARTELRDSRGVSLAEVVQGWKDRTLEMQSGLGRLMGSLKRFEISASSGDFDANIEFDTQHQTKLFLLHNVINTTIGYRLAERYLTCCLAEPLPAKSSSRKKPKLEELQLDVFRGVFRRDTAIVHRRIPDLLKQLAKKPLLYVSLENGGDPEQVLEVRTLQAGIRFLLSQLPALGLVDDTWQLLYTAFRMEKTLPPKGQAVTEFDRLFRIALRGALEAVSRSATTWRLPPVRSLFVRRGPKRCLCRQELRRPERAQLASEPSVSGDRCKRCTPARRVPGVLARRRKSDNARSRRPMPLHPPRTGRPLSFHVPSRLGLSTNLDTLGQERIGWRNASLVALVSGVVNAFRDLWTRHSATMRLSTVEALQNDMDWRDVQKFIKSYGHDLFHARMLMIGNVRAILHNGIDWFLQHLDENEDPLHPVPLLEALRTGQAESNEVEHWMELIYGAIVDKFDRFLEYNTTTTQSDYGEMLYSLLDFLRVEAAYDRRAWQLAPENVCHELLSELGRTQAANVWERLYEEQTTEQADVHIKALKTAEQQHGMRLPSLSDHIHERFVKPLAVNRMLALVPRAVQDARTERARSAAFEALRHEIDQYLDSTSGSGIDVPSWLRNLEREVERVLESEGSPRDPHDPDIRLAPRRLTLKQTQRQIESCERLVREFLNHRRT